MPEIRLRGFSLMEVVIALGVFTVGILALVALVGPLLIDLKDGRDQAHTAQLIALTNAWLRSEASTHFESARDRFVAGGEGVDLYLYLWSEAGSESGWKAVDRDTWRGDFAKHRGGSNHFRSALYRITLTFDPSLHPDSVSAERFRALRAVIATVPVGEPERMPGEIEEALARARPSGTFFTSFHQ